MTKRHGYFATRKLSKFYYFEISLGSIARKMGNRIEYLDRSFDHPATTRSSRSLEISRRNDLNFVPREKTLPCRSKDRRVTKLSKIASRNQTIYHGKKRTMTRAIVSRRWPTRQDLFLQKCLGENRFYHGGH